MYTFLFSLFVRQRSWRMRKRIFRVLFRLFDFFFSQCRDITNIDAEKAQRGKNELKPYSSMNRPISKNEKKSRTRSTTKAIDGDRKSESRRETDSQTENDRTEIGQWHFFSFNRSNIGDPLIINPILFQFIALLRFDHWKDSLRIFTFFFLSVVDCYFFREKSNWEKEKALRICLPISQCLSRALFRFFVSFSIVNKFQQFLSCVLSKALSVEVSFSDSFFISFFIFVLFYPSKPNNIRCRSFSFFLLLGLYFLWASTRVLYSHEFKLLSTSST